MTRNEFKPLLLFIAKGCRVEFDREQVAAWYASLCDLPADSVAVAMARFVCEIGKWPDIATVRRFAVEALNGESRPWSEALEDARKAVRRFGAYRQADARKSLDDSTWKAIQSLGGWQKLCDWRRTVPTRSTLSFETVTGTSPNELTRGEPCRKTSALPLQQHSKPMARHAGCLEKQAGLYRY